MIRTQFISNLIIIARLGTRKFMKAIEEETDLILICKFGVGLFSSFLVTDKVVVTSKHNGDD
jgi:molecular chaperone HtpG